MLKFAILFSKGLLRNQQTRRLIMFYDVIAALVMLFAGCSFLAGWLRGHLLSFMAYWALCGLLTLLALLLALFDLLMLRLVEKRERVKLREKYLAQDREEPKD